MYVINERKHFAIHWKKLKLIILHDYVLRAFDVREKDIWLSVSDQQNYLFRMDEKI